ncbi:MAG: hypothetical protein K2P68_05175, partial [Sphingomonas sp.]|nr:hypothetical protein [Sphingomonas sp.]
REGDGHLNPTSNLLRALHPLAPLLCVAASIGHDGRHASGPIGIAGEKPRNGFLGPVEYPQDANDGGRERWRAASNS